MIDYIALSIGHGLITVALLRLFLRDNVDFDPLIDGIKQELEQSRSAVSTAARNAKRRAKTKAGDAEADQLDVRTRGSRQGGPRGRSGSGSSRTDHSGTEHSGTGRG